MKKEAACMGSKPPEGVVHFNSSRQMLAPICPPEFNERTEGMDTPTSAGKVGAQAIQLPYAKDLVSTSPLTSTRTS